MSAFVRRAVAKHGPGGFVTAGMSQIHVLTADGRNVACGRLGFARVDTYYGPGGVPMDHPSLCWWCRRVLTRGDAVA